MGIEQGVQKESREKSFYQKYFVIIVAKKENSKNENTFYIKSSKKYFQIFKVTR